MWEMTSICVKCLICEITYGYRKKTDICGNWLKYVIERLKNVRNVLSMWKMTYIYIKWLKEVGNGVDM